MKDDNAEYDEVETARRRDAAILRALTTPSVPQKAEPRPQSAKAEAQRQRRSREKAGKSPSPPA